jgi:hypothetical protein
LFTIESVPSGVRNVFALGSRSCKWSEAMGGGGDGGGRLGWRSRQSLIRRLQPGLRRRRSRRLKRHPASPPRDEGFGGVDPHDR